MWPFKRKQPTTGKVPPVVKQYYDSEHRERVGLAWLIAFLSLILTVVIVAGLFFGGRWAYRKVANRNEPQTVSQGASDVPIQTPNPTTPSKPNDLQPAAPSQTDSTNSSAGVAAGSASQGHTSSISTTANQSQKSASQITNTGPGSNLAVFLAVTGVATLLHSTYLRRRKSAIN